MPVAVAGGAAGTGRGAGVENGADTGTYVEKDGYSCGSAPPGDESPGVRIRGGVLASKSNALV